MIKKAIIIGNGISINEHISRGDFDLIIKKKIHTFALNQIHRIYHRTSWRPTHWLWVDSTIDDWDVYINDAIVYHIMPRIENVYIGRRYAEIINEILNETFRFPEDFDLVIQVDRCHGRRNHGVQVNEGQSINWHLPELCRYGGSIGAVLQLAFMLGYTDIGIIGCDLNTKEGGGDHFDSDYHTNLDYGFTYTLHDDTLRHVHKIAKENFEVNGRRIVNIGIGGLLETYDRVDFRSWVNDNNS